MRWPSLYSCSTHIDSFRQGLSDTLGAPVSKKFRRRKSVCFIFAHPSMKIDPQWRRKVKGVEASDRIKKTEPVFVIHGIDEKDWDDEETGKGAI